MASSRSYLEYILDNLSGLDDISHRAMMGEYIIYYRGKIAAYICDDRLLVKPVAAAERLLPEMTGNFCAGFLMRCMMNCLRRRLGRKSKSSE